MVRYRSLRLRLRVGFASGTSHRNRLWVGRLNMIALASQPIHSPLGRPRKIVTSSVKKAQRFGVNVSSFGRHPNRRPNSRYRNSPSNAYRMRVRDVGCTRVADRVASWSMHSNRQSAWLERALKRNAKHRARPSGLTAVQSAVLDAVRVSSRPSLWWRGANADQPAPTLHVHVFKCALSGLPEQLLLDAMPASTTTQGAARISCHHQCGFPHRTTTAAG